MAKESERITELCEEMDEENILARIPTGHGRTSLDDYRSFLLDLVRNGSPLPIHWYGREQAKQLEQRHTEYGTREWRKAYPWLVNEFRKGGVIKI